MKKAFGVMAVAGMLLLCGQAYASPWETFVIRNSAAGSPIIQSNANYADSAREFITLGGGQKAGWGNNDLSGQAVGSISAIKIDRLDDTGRFTAGSGPAVAPYFNIWITDGSNYAVIANEPSNPEWAGSQWDMDWATLSTKTVKVYENSDKTWLPDSGVGLLFADLAAFTIKAPSAAELSIGWAGLGGGAPRELGTNDAYAFNWIFGDTLSNYVSGETEGFVVDNPVAIGAAPVPEPGTFVLLGLGLAGLGVVARRRNRKA